MQPMKVHRVEPVRAQVARALRSAITELRIKPGELLIERELCDLTGASRPSVREALRQLESEGLVTSVTGKGTVVSTIGPGEARELYQVRAVMEGLAGRLFAANAAPAEREALETAVNRFEAEMSEPEQLLAIKNDFYTILFDGAGNPLAAQMSLSLRRRASQLRAMSLTAGGRPEQTLRELRAILAAIEERDADRAEQLCRDHVGQAQRAALRHFGEPTRH